ncbi:hypothetical protein C0995_004609 [Termitomyces sp. Mi166|nr:hypothetical protein C0995_004609 [Termitomyces sp. Mi166\
MFGQDYGVKANLKSEALIDLLIDTAKPLATSTPTRRSVSTRQSNRAGPSRISSIIIHDTDKGKEDETDTNDHTHDPNSAPASTSHQEPTPPLATRTRKRKEQTRLGVGRPVVAGGAGPRAVTKSLSLTKGKRGKPSRTLKSTEATIPEEEVEQDHHIALQDLPDISQEEYTSQALRKQASPEASLDSLATIDKHVADAVSHLLRTLSIRKLIDVILELRPLHEQMKSMKSELELVQALKTEVGELKARISEIGSLKERVESLTTTIRDLRKEADEATALRLDTNQHKKTLPIQVDATPSTPKMRSSARENRAGPSGFGAPQLPVRTALGQSSDSLAVAGSSTNVGLHPGFAPSMLGKRHRDSAASELVDNNREIDRTVDGTPHMKPSRKRAKISLEHDESMDPNVSQEGTIEDYVSEQERASDAFRGSSFRVFSGLEASPMELADPPPPTESLPDFFATSTLALEAPIIPRGNRATSTANATENQQPFAFSFQHAISSTPAYGMFMPSFPYPEPPQSPSPAGTSAIGLPNQQQSGRLDVFQAFGFPPGRPLRTTGFPDPSGLTGGFVDPTALARQSSINGETSESDARLVDAGSSTGVGIIQSSHMKRTMYGTELDGDTRFGDFGLEGVGNAKGGFWAGGRF